MRVNVDPASRTGKSAAALSAEDGCAEDGCAEDGCAGGDSTTGVPPDPGAPEPQALSKSQGKATAVRRRAGCRQYIRYESGIPINAILAQVLERVQIFNISVPRLTVAGP